mmetsp:Transcript_30229/g.81234  ORF Transcript_30229/g.81234 Transcript_30229/m.81234 type:complete len:207 (-) Transcript_30229:1862-2482(-)
MWLAKPTSSYSPSPSSAGAPPPPAAVAGPASTPAALASAARTALSRSSMCEKSQSPARSKLPPVSMRAALACVSVKPMPQSISTAAGSAPAPAAGGAPPWSRGVSKSGSSMCASTHSMPASGPALPVATAARLAPLAGKPISTSALTISSLGSGCVAPAAPAGGPWSSGSSVSVGCRPVARRRSRESVSGARTLASNFLGVQSSPT